MIDLHRLRLWGCLTIGVMWSTPGFADSLTAPTVTVAGVGSKIEIWDRNRFEESLTQSNARCPEMARSVAEKLGM